MATNAAWPAVPSRCGVAHACHVWARGAYMYVRPTASAALSGCLLVIRTTPATYSYVRELYPHWIGCRMSALYVHVHMLQQSACRGQYTYVSTLDVVVVLVSLSFVIFASGAGSRRRRSVINRRACPALPCPDGTYGIDASSACCCVLPAGRFRVEEHVCHRMPARRVALAL
jgi:hypothetical protein